MPNSKVIFSIIPRPFHKAGIPPERNRRPGPFSAVCWVRRFAWPLWDREAFRRISERADHFLASCTVAFAGVRTADGSVKYSPTSGQGT